MTEIRDHGELVWVAHADLRPGPNPRKTFDEAELAALAESIAAQGLLQNLVVTTPLFPDLAANGVRVVVAGERRYRAIGLLIEQGRWEESRPIPCRLVEADPGTIRALALLENLQRQDVPPLEQADAFRDLQALDPERWSVAAIAAAIGRTPRYVQQYIALSTKLAPQARDMLAAGKISFTQARELVTLAPAAQKQAATDAAWKITSAGDAIHRKAIGSMFALRHAKFDRALYTGEVYEDDDGAVYAVDRKAALKLQEAWAKARAAEIGGTVTRENQWFKPGDGHWSNGWRYAKSAVEKKRAVTLIVIDSSEGSIREFKNVVAIVEKDQPGKALHNKWEHERAENQKRFDAQRREAEAVRDDIVGRDPTELFLLLSTMPTCATREIVRAIARQVEPDPQWGCETTEHSPAVMLLRRLLGVTIPPWLVIDADLENDDEDDTAARTHLAALDAGTYSAAYRRRAEVLAEQLDQPAAIAEQPAAEPEPTLCTNCNRPPRPADKCHYAMCPAKLAAKEAAA